MKNHPSIPLLRLLSIIPIFLLAALLSTQAHAQFGPLADPGTGTMVDPNAPSSTGTPATTAPFAINPDKRPPNAHTVIDSDTGASFENATSSAEFNGHVVVNDPQFNLTCDKLHVLLRADRKGLSKVIATGTVVITQVKQNKNGDIVKSIGKCGKATYDAASGDVTMEDWPQVQQGINNQVATEQTTVMVLNAKGHSHTTGGSRTEIVDQGTNSTPVTP